MTYSKLWSATTGLTALGQTWLPAWQEWKKAGIQQTHPVTNVIEYGYGGTTVRDRLDLIPGTVFRGKGIDQTTLVVPPSLFERYGTGSWFATTVPNAPGYSHGGGWLFADHPAFHGIGIGIEDLTIEFPPLTTTPAHHYEPGYNGIHFFGCVDSWVKRVRILNCDNGILCSRDTSHCLFEDIEIAGPGRPSARTGHYGFRFSHGSHNLVRRYRIGSRYNHDVSVQNETMYNVISEGQHKQGQFDHHKGNPHHNLFTDIDMGQGGKVLTSNSGTPGSGPQSGVYETLWNVRLTGGASIGTLPDTTNYPKLVVVGHHQNVNTASRYVEAISPLSVAPGNLYEALIGPNPTPPPPKFLINQTVVAIAPLIIRYGPAKSTTKLGEQPTGASGIIKDGPALDGVSGFTYYRVDFASGVDGWCGEDKLQ